MDGRAPTAADNEVALDVDVAKKAGKAVGDPYHVRQPQGPREYQVVGTVSFGSGNPWPGPPWWRSPCPRPNALGPPGKVQTIDVAVRSGASVDRCTEIQAILPPAPKW